MTSSCGSVISGSDRITSVIWDVELLSAAGKSHCSLQAVSVIITVVDDQSCMYIFFYE